MFSKAIVRKPGANFSGGLTSSDLGKPNFQKTLEQHQAYINALTQCGIEVTILEADPKFPDGCFVEDVAVVTEEMAVITRPGDIARLGEQEKIASQLFAHKKLEYIFEKGTLEGGDIMRVGNHFYIGRSKRTNAEGAKQLAEILEKYGFSSSEIPVKNVLHLKTGITHLKEDMFVAVPEFLPYFKNKRVIPLAIDEFYMANCLYINDQLLIPKGFSKMNLKLENLGFKTIQIEMSEFEKMDGGLTCLSLLF